MSVKVSAWIWQHSDAAGNDLLLLLALADVADDAGMCWPSISHIAAKTRLHGDTVRRRLRGLESDGRVVSESRVGRSSRYWVSMNDPPANCTPPQTATPPHGAPSTPPHGAGDTPPHSLRGLPIKDTSLSTTHHSLQDCFAEFWTVYPRREAKRAAVKTYAAAAKRADPQLILAGARRYADDPNREPEFTAHPATWLNRDGWDDDPLPARGATRASPSDQRAEQNLALVRQYAEQERQAIQ